MNQITFCNVNKHKLTMKEMEELRIFLENKNDEEAIKLINTMSDINQSFSFPIFAHTTILKLACMYQRVEIVEYLIDLGVNVNNKNDDLGYSPLMISCNHEDIYLINSNINMNKCGGYALYCISGFHYFEIANLLIESGVKINSISNGFSSLHNACSNNNFEMIKYLLDNGANKNIKNINGKFPIEETENEEIKEFINNYNSSKFILK